MKNRDSNIDLLIIGGGVQGMYLFHLLKQEKGSDVIIKIADPHAAPLHNWRHITANTGMKFLRSPAVHHIDIEPMSLHKFSEKQSLPRPEAFIAPNSRPSLQLFNTHSTQVVDSYNMEEHWIQTHIHDIEILEDGARVYGSSGEIHTKHVLLALGNGGQLNYPSWSEHLQAQSFPISHIYSTEFSISTYNSGLHTVIIGNGMGAVQAFIELAEKHENKVTLLTNSQIEVSQYDIEPGWMGAKYLTAFHKTKDLNKRRAMITSARKRGTITPDVKHDFKKALTLEHANHIIGDIETVEKFGSDSALIKLNNGDSVFCDQILLGTGFRPVIESELVQNLMAKPALKCSKCGYPIVNHLLQWHPHICVAGELAELELGPAAKNIIGARHAGARLRHMAF